MNRKSLDFVVLKSSERAVSESNDFQTDNGK